MSGGTETGAAFRCGTDGTVIRVLRDDIGLSKRAPPGAPLESLVDPAARDKLRAFAEAVKDKQASFDWEITVATDAGLVPLHFAGVQTEEGLLVIAARTRSALLRMNEEMLRINNEQTNTLRAMSKELATVSARNADRDDTMFDDLTRVNNELANLQRELVRRNAELLMLNEEKNRFLGIAAHDLRSPIGVILTYSEFLESEAADVLDGEQREFVSAIRSTSQFILRLLDDLLDVSLIESGKLDLDLQTVDLVALLRHNLALNRALAGRKQIDLRFLCGLETLQIFADTAKVEQVLNNLIGNAIKYSPSDARVDVELAATPEFATIAIEDEGPGIPAADLPKLFKPFGKASVRPTQGEKSSGLGLAIVRRVVEGHGGEVGVESEVGRGSRFRFSLPRAVPASQPVSPVAAGS